jgi:hypothetical protein
VLGAFGGGGDERSKKDAAPTNGGDWGGYG